MLALLTMGGAFAQECFDAPMVLDFGGVLGATYYFPVNQEGLDLEMFVVQTPEEEVVVKELFDKVSDGGFEGDHLAVTWTDAGLVAEAIECRQFPCKPDGPAPPIVERYCVYIPFYGWICIVIEIP